jgi:hypothetical protein
MRGVLAVVLESKCLSFFLCAEENVMRERREINQATLAPIAAMYKNAGMTLRIANTKIR